MLGWPDKGQDEVLDYALDWRLRLGEDKIAESTWSLASGDVEIGSSSVSGAKTVVWLSGGGSGVQVLRNQVVTDGGRTMEQSVSLQIRSR